MSYDLSKYLDPRWIKRREEIFVRDGRTCCYDATHTGVMQVHHVYYLPDTDPWDYPDDALKTVCKTCNSIERLWQKEFKSLIKHLVSDKDYSYEQLHLYLSGLLSPLHIKNELRCELGALASGRFETLEFTRNYINNIIGVEIL